MGIIMKDGIKYGGIENQSEISPSDIAIIVDGDTPSIEVPVGGYAYIKNNAHGLAEGLYTNTSTSAFPATEGAEANSDIFTAVNNGGLNAIQQSMMCNGYMTWSDITVPSGTWLTNTGSESEGRRPSGMIHSNSYNLYLDIPGTYLINFHLIMQATKKDGIRGIRIYKTEQSTGLEYFVNGVDSPYKTALDFSRIIESNGNDSVRMGLYQSSGASITASDIQIAAIMLSR